MEQDIQRTGISDGSSPQDKLITYSRLRIIKNLVILSFGFLIMFTGYSALSMLQSTMNRDAGVGVASQAIIYALICVASLFFAKYFIKRFGCKHSLVVCMLCYAPYIAYNFYPQWILMVPTSMLTGLAGSVLWGSQGTYLNELATLYFELEAPLPTSEETSDKYKMDKSEPFAANLKKASLKTPNTKQEMLDETDVDLNSDRNGKDRPEFRATDLASINARFFGFFGMAHLSVLVWSNLLSYYVLRIDAVQKNITISTNCTCGSNFCNVASECFEENIQGPSTEIRYLLTGICCILIIVAALLVALFLDPAKPGRKDVTFSLDFLTATCRLITKTKHQLLIPLTFYVGLVQAFYAGDFTKSYIGCAWGTYNVGLVSIAYGSTSALSSAVFGWLVKIFGRMTIFLILEVVNVTAIVFLLLWNPEATNPSLFFLGAGLWGIAAGGFWSQLEGYYGVIFRGEDEEVGFAAFLLWQSLGFCFSFAYSEYVCTFIKLYVLLAVSTIGFICYLISEYQYFLKK